jgi:NCAIR mutase (PurE)-related protein
MEATVDRQALRRLLRRVRAGRTGVDAALEELRHLPFEDLGFATLDHHRALRRGYPEVVYGQGKTADQVVTIVGRLARTGQPVLVTRVGGEVHEAVAAAHPAAVYHPLARVVVVPGPRRPARRPGILVLSAGTSDLPVAEEAAVTAEVLGNAVERVYDVGVAGLHRLLARRVALSHARVIVAVAGMEGALPSVVAGLTDCPVIGVPTSTGYGAGAGGQAALLAMLNACASGVAVVNIDNGFGAGMLASMINRPRPRPRGAPASRAARNRG